MRRRRLLCAALAQCAAAAGCPLHEGVDFAAALGVTQCAGGTATAESAAECKAVATESGCDAFAYLSATQLCTLLRGRPPPAAAPASPDATSGYVACAEYELVGWGPCRGDDGETLRAGVWSSVALTDNGAARHCEALCDADGECVGYMTGSVAGAGSCAVLLSGTSGVSDVQRGGSGQTCWRRAGQRYAVTWTYRDRGEGCCRGGDGMAPLLVDAASLQRCKDQCEELDACNWVTWDEGASECMLRTDCEDGAGDACAASRRRRFERAFPAVVRAAPLDRQVREREPEAATGVEPGEPEASRRAEPQSRRATPSSWSSQTGCPLTWVLHNETVSTGSTTVSALERLSGWVGHQGWNSGAESVEHPIYANSLIYGVQFRCGQNNTHVMIGLRTERSANASIAAIDQYSYPDIDFAMYCAAGTLRVVESGQHKGPLDGDATYGPSDVLQVRIDEDLGIVEYVKNGVVQHRSSGFTLPLGVDVSMHSLGSTITNIQWLGCSDTSPTCLETLIADPTFCTSNSDRVNQDSLTHTCFGRKCLVAECCRKGLRPFRSADAVISVGSFDSSPDVYSITSTMLTTSKGVVCYEQGDIQCRAFVRNPVDSAPVTGLSLGDAARVTDQFWSDRNLGDHIFNGSNVPAGGMTTSLALTTMDASRAMLCMSAEAGNGTCSVITLSGTSTLTASTLTVFNERKTQHVALTSMSRNIAVVCYHDQWEEGYWTNGTCNVLQTVGAARDRIVVGADVMFSQNAVKHLAMTRVDETTGILCYAGDARAFFPGTKLFDEKRRTKRGEWGGYVYEPEPAGHTDIGGLTGKYRQIGMCRMLKVPMNNSEHTQGAQQGQSDLGSQPPYGGVQTTMLTFGTETVFSEVDTAAISVIAATTSRFVVCYSDLGTGGSRTWKYDGEYGLCRELTLSTSADAYPDLTERRYHDQADVDEDVHGVTSSLLISAGSSIVIQEANVSASTLDVLSEGKGVVVCWAVSTGTAATTLVANLTSAYGVCNELSLLKEMPHHATPDIVFHDTEISSPSFGIFESARHGVALPGVIVGVVCYRDVYENTGVCKLLTALSEYPLTATPTPTSTKPTITVTPLATQTLTLVYSLHVYRNRFDTNTSLEQVSPHTNAIISDRFWVNPPYSLRVKGGAVTIRLSGTSVAAERVFVGVDRPAQLSWWFRIRADTPGVLFSVATDWATQLDGISRSASPHMMIEASPSTGLVVRTAVAGFPCSGHGSKYGVLHNTWHQMQVTFTWPSVNASNTGTLLKVSLDGAQVCSLYWNHTATILSALHVEPHRPAPFGSCGDPAGGRHCVGGTGYTDLADRKPVCDDSAYDCRQCCELTAKATGRVGCCSWRASPPQCSYHWGGKLREVADSEEYAASCSAHANYDQPCSFHDETGTGAAPGGWVPEKITDLGTAGKIHGPWGSDVKEVQQVFNLTRPHPGVERSHKTCTVSFRSWASHVRDGDYNRLLIDDRQVWKMKAQYGGCANGWRAGPANFPYSTTLNPACFIDVSLRVPCGEKLDLKFTSDVDQWIGFHSWAFSDLKITIDDCGLEKGAVYIDDVVTCETAGCAPWYAYRPFDCTTQSDLGFRVKLFSLHESVYAVGDPVYGATFYRLEWTSKSTAATVFELVGWTGKPSQTVHIRETETGRYLAACTASNGTMSWQDQPSYETEWVFEFVGDWAAGTEVQMTTARGPANSDGSNARLWSSMLSSTTYEGRCAYGTDWAPGRWLLEPVDAGSGGYEAAQPHDLATTGAHPPHDPAPHQTPYNDGYRCALHPRCAWHAEKATCVEHPLSEMVGAWAETRLSDVEWDSNEMLSDVTGWLGAGESGRWINSSTYGGATAGCDGASCPSSHPTAVLRSPEFVVGWLTEIVVSVTAGSQTGFTDANGPADLNGTSFSGGFLGVALQWNGSWVATRRACIDTAKCNVRFLPRELRRFLHQTVTIDIIDNAAGSDGWIVAHDLKVSSPAQELPWGWLSSTGWILGRPCGPETWTGVTCDSYGSITAVKQPGYWFPSYQLSGDFSLVDWSALANLTTLDLGDQAGINGSLTDPEMELQMSLGISDLRLGGTGLTGGVPSIRRLWYLQHINISSTGLGGTIPEHWLESPYRGYPELPMAIPGRYGSPYSLKSVNLSYSGVSGTIPAGLARHESLERLLLRQNVLTGTIPSPLGTALRVLDVAYNGLTGVAPLRVPGYVSGSVDSSGTAYGLAIDGEVYMNHNGLYGLVPDWIRYVASWELHNNDWCCPLPAWANSPPPYDAPGYPPSLAWSRAMPASRTALTCTRVALNADPSSFGYCPTIVGSCDGSVWCGHQQCGCDDGPQGGFIVGSSTDSKCPGYRGCGCDMRRLRCIYRPEKPTWCNFTTNGICIDSDHTFDYTPHPALNPYYGDTESNRYHG